jgi:hypothetical protein
VFVGDPNTANDPAPPIELALTAPKYGFPPEKPGAVNTIFKL